MQKKALLALTDHERIAWLSCDDQGHIEQELCEDSLANIAPQIKTQQIIVFVPSQDVLLTEIVLPPLKRQQLFAAVCYAIEDILLEEPEHYHFVIGEKNANGKTTVAVVLKNTLQAWLTRLETAGITPQILLPNCLALHYSAESWHVYLDEKQALVRTGLVSGFATDLENIDILLTEQWKNTNEKEKPQFLQIDNFTQHIIAIEGLNQKNQLPPQFLLTQATRELAPLNLLQQHYPIQKTKRPLPKVWRITSYSFIVTLLILLITQIVNYGYLSHQQQQRHSQIQQQLQDILPEAVVAELNNAQIEVKIQQLIQADSGGIFLQLLSRVGQVLQQQGLLIQNMRFSGQTLQLEMILPPVTQQQTVLAALKAQNLQIQTTTQAMVWKLQMQLQR